MLIIHLELLFIFHAMSIYVHIRSIVGYLILWKRFSFILYCFLFIKWSSLYVKRVCQYRNASIEFEFNFKFCCKSIFTLFFRKINVNWFIDIKFFSIIEILECANKTFFKDIWQSLRVIVPIDSSMKLVIDFFFFGL